MSNNAEEMSNNKDCPICLEKFTGAVRKEVKCQYCQYGVCVTCVKRYMLESLEDPHCMNCRRAWNRDFIDSYLSMAFRKGALKKHREDVLLDREKARLPLLQPRIEARVQSQDILSEINQFNKKIREMEMAITVEREKVTRLYRRQHRLEEIAAGRLPVGTDLDGSSEKKEVRQFTQKCPVEDCRGFLSTAWKCGTCQTWVCSDCLVPKGQDKDAPHTCNEDAKATAALIKKETKPCPKCGMGISKIDGCFAKDTPILLWNGSIKMAQDICVGDILIGDDGESRQVEELCSGGDEMYEVSQGNGMTYIVNSKHKLALKMEGNNTIIEIVLEEYIHLDETLKSQLYGFKKDNTLTTICVKPVGKGTYYGWSISGNKRFLLGDFTVARNCDQMWCVSCQTPFSWATGRQVFGVVHNPHYYQWLRGQNGGEAPRVAGDVPCGGLIGFWNLSQMIPATNRKEVEQIHRVTAEILDTILRNYPRLDEVPDNGDLGIHYTLKEIDIEKWKAELWKRETKREKGLDLRGPLDLFANVSSEVLRQMARGGTPAEFEALLEQLRALREYVNTELEKIGVRYGNMTPKITECWHWDAHGNNRGETKDSREYHERIIVLSPENVKAANAAAAGDLKRICGWAMPLKKDAAGNERYGVDSGLFGSLSSTQRELVRKLCGERNTVIMPSAAGGSGGAASGGAAAAVAQ